MTNKKAAPAGTSATPKTSKSACNPTPKARIKAVIVDAALLGLVPMSWARWLIRRLGLSDA